MGIYRNIRKAVRKTGQAVKRRYGAKAGGRKSTGGVRVMKMAKDIMYLKSVLNPEKKRTEESNINIDPFGEIPLGQVNANNDGAFVRDITPFLTSGTGYNQRNGASVKLHSSIWNMQFNQQANTINTIRGILEIWAITDDPYSNVETFRREKYQLNPFVTPSGSAPRDLHCQYNPDNYMKGRCIAKRRFSVVADQLTGQKSLTNLKIPIKYNKGQGHHLRWDKDSTTLLNGQLIMVIRCDRGNMGTISTLTGVQDVATLTGLTFQYSVQHYYYDN